MCTDEKANVQQGAEQEQSPQGFAEAPGGVPENHEEKMYASPEAAAGYAVGGQTPQAPEGYMYQQPQMMQQPQMPEGYMYQQPQPQMMQPPQGQPMYYMPQPQMMQPPQMPFMGQPMGGPVPPQPQMPFMGQPQQGGPKGGGCSHDNQSQDPFGGMFGMFGEMVDNNPNLSAINKMVSATNSDFLKGAMLGAGLTLLLTSDGVKEMLTGLFAGAAGMFGNEEDTGDENE